MTAQGINDEHGEKFIIVNLSHFCDAIVKEPKLFVGGKHGDAQFIIYIKRLLEEVNLCMETKLLMSGAKTIIGSMSSVKGRGNIVLFRGNPF